MLKALKLSGADFFLAIACGVGFVFWRQSAELRPPFDVYPKWVSLALLVLSFACILQNRFQPGTKSQARTFRSLIKTAGMLLGIGVYIVCIEKIGYFVSTFVYLMTMLQLSKFGDDEAFLETKPLLIDSLFAGGMAVGIALVFKVALSLVFPSAWLF